MNFKASDGKGLQWGTNGSNLTNWNVYVHRNGSNAYATGINLGYRFQGDVPQTLAITVTGSTFRAKYDNENSSAQNYSGHENDGAHSVTTPNQTWAGSSLSVDQFALGDTGFPPDGSRAWSGRIYEVIIYEKALTDKEANNIRTFLDQTYNNLGWANRTGYY